MALVGSPPRDLGLVEINDGEMLFTMYLPISVPDDHSYKLPDHLKRFAPIVSTVKQEEPARFFREFVYLTAKTLWVEGSHIGNRPGWHSDGFGTNDLNFIWADRAPTEFMVRRFLGLWQVSDDCDQSMREMEKLGRYAEAYDFPFTTYPDRHLLRLDPTVMHRSPVKFEAGLRTFVKVSISPDQYNLSGNAVNHLLPETHWPLVDRQTVRNHPSNKDHA